MIKLIKSFTRAILGIKMMRQEELFTDAHITEGTRQVPLTDYQLPHTD